ncbi:hypothetical protein HAZT_HAZT003753 [Hyalella azteca]|nr:hypothetical protein HAZT_HAZT003753 [Hyalella azteca]
MAEEAESQKVKFSPHRQRDMNSAHIAAKLSKAGAGSVFGKGLDVSSSINGNSFNVGTCPKDLHASVYDKSNACSLSSVMQTNVPQPFKSDGKGERSGHLTMPGGQWAQNDKYISSDLHEYHYSKNSGSSKAKSQNNTNAASTSSDETVRGGSLGESFTFFALHKNASFPNIALYPDITNLKACGTSLLNPGTKAGRLYIDLVCSSVGNFNAQFSSQQHFCPSGVVKFLSSSSSSVIQQSKFSSSSTTWNNVGGAHDPKEKNPNTSNEVLTSGQKIKRAVKEYGAAVIVFHVTISLASLGFFYLLVSSGVDMEGLIQRLGIDLSDAADASSAMTSPADDVSVEGDDVIAGADASNNTHTGGKLSTAGNVAAGVSTFVVAYAIHKVFAPARVGITLSVVPFAVRYYRRTWQRR